jgi:UDP-glucose 4-epimerase
VITKFCGCVRAGRRPIIYGDGEQTRDFVHVDDVANALARSLGRGGYPTPINIASGKEVSVKSLLKTCCAIADVPADAKCLPERPGEIERSVADISLARRVLGYSPKIALEQGIRELLEQ